MQRMNLDRSAARFGKFHHAALVITLVLVAFLTGVAVIAPKFYDPSTQYNEGLSAEGLPLPPNSSFLLGTDDLGRDELSRVIVGARVSLFVGTIGSLIATMIGVTIGLVAGYSKGLTGTLLMRFTDIMMAFPYLLFAVALQAVLGPGIRNLLISIGAITWVNAARVMYGLALAESARTYVLALQVFGMSRARILMRHVLPNVAGAAVVLFTTGIGYTMLAESALSYLGLGVQPPTPTWGNMVRDGQSYFLIAPWLTLVPGFFIVISVAAFNILGDQLYELWDSRT
jgi:peptide/nickel transport system permease protein